MAITDVQVRTIACNRCDKTVTFDMKQHAEIIKLEGNEWLKTSRVVNRGDGQIFVYCSDACELTGIENGDHNIPEPKTIVSAPASVDAIRVAAQAADAASKATKDIKAGRSTKLQIVQS